MAISFFKSSNLFEIFIVNMIANCTRPRSLFCDSENYVAVAWKFIHQEIQWTHKLRILAEIKWLCVPLFCWQTGIPSPFPFWLCMNVMGFLKSRVMPVLKKKQSDCFSSNKRTSNLKSSMQCKGTCTKPRMVQYVPRVSSSIELNHTLYFHLAVQDEAHKLVIHLLWLTLNQTENLGSSSRSGHHYIQLHKRKTLKKTS